MSWDTYRIAAPDAERLGQKHGEDAALDYLHEHGHYHLSNVDAYALLPMAQTARAAIWQELDVRLVVDLTSDDWAELNLAYDAAFEDQVNYRAGQAGEAVDMRRRPGGFGLI